VKQQCDAYTVDFLDAPRRGRPRKPNALTPAERAKRYRENKRAAHASSPESLSSFLAESGVHTRDDLADMTMDEAKSLIIKARSFWFEGPRE
jgi:hypothetical protein